MVLKTTLKSNSRTANLGRLGRWLTSLVDNAIIG